MLDHRRCEDGLGVDRSDPRQQNDYYSGQAPVAIAALMLLNQKLVESFIRGKNGKAQSM